VSSATHMSTARLPALIKQDKDSDKTGQGG